MTEDLLCSRGGHLNARAFLLEACYVIDRSLTQRPFRTSTNYLGLNGLDHVDFASCDFMPNGRRLGFNRGLGVFAALSSDLFSAIDTAKGDNFLILPNCNLVRRFSSILTGM